MSDELAAPDLVLVVKAGGNDGLSFSIEAASDLPGTDGFKQTRENLGSFLIPGIRPNGSDDLIDQLREPGVEDIRLWSTRASRESAIRKLGTYLWNILPKEFVEFYWEVMHRQDLSILIFTDNLRFPWELVLPNRRGQPDRLDDIFGVAFSIARWPNGTELPTSFNSSGSFLIVAPGIEDSGADDEVHLLPVRHPDRLDPATFAKLKIRLNDGKIRVLHVRAHGRLEAQGHSIDLLPADGAEAPHRIFPGHLLQLTNQERESLSGSLVFLNVCEAGQKGPNSPPADDSPGSAAKERPTGPIHIGGWANGFVDVGCSAVVGPYWDVGSDVASRVARSFYGHLQEGETIGETMRLVRRRFTKIFERRDRCCNYSPTCLAYTVVGHPNLRSTWGSDES